MLYYDACYGELNDGTILKTFVRNYADLKLR